MNLPQGVGLFEDLKMRQSMTLRGLTWLNFLTPSTTSMLAAMRFANLQEFQEYD